MSDTTNIANLAMIADDLKEQIDRFIKKTKCVGEDVTVEEFDMYVYLQKASDYIGDYLATQQMDNRKFEVGKSYYTEKWYDVYTVESRTDKSVKFAGNALGNSRISPYYCKHGEEINGNLLIKA